LSTANDRINEIFEDNSMQVSDIEHGERTTLELQPAHDADFGKQIQQGTEAALFFEPTDTFLLQIGAESWTVKGINEDYQLALTEMINRNLPKLCWVAAHMPKQKHTQTIMLQVHEFPNLYIWHDPIELGVDEKIVAQIRKKRQKLITVKETVNWLNDKIILSPIDTSTYPRVLLSGIPTRLISDASGFRLYGQGVAVDIVREQEDRLMVRRMVEAKLPTHHSEQRPILLVQGAFQFCDATVAGQFRGTAQTELDQLVKNADSYLKIWQDYNQLERKNLLEQARQFGWLKYRSRKLHPEKEELWQFELEEETLDKTDLVLQYFTDSQETTLEAVEVIPAILQNTEVGITETEIIPKKKSRVFAGQYINYQRQTKIIMLQAPPENETEPPQQGFIIMSLSGDETRLERRDKAHSLILTAKCPMPQLGLLIEGQKVPERRRFKHEKALSAAARDIFNGDPTPRQHEALRLALATPDIFLIQGPPGTGKTRTIAALQTRLAEIAEDVDGISGHTLLTSYQHDAVEHVASQTQVFGLPAIKVGKKRNQSEIVDGFDSWRRERIQAVKTLLESKPEGVLLVKLTQVRELAAGYRLVIGEGEEAAKTVLRQVAEIAQSQLPPTLKDRLLALRQKLERNHIKLPSRDDQARLIKTVRTLRTTSAAFADDGTHNAHKTWLRFSKAKPPILTSQEQALLEQATKWEAIESPPFLVDLKTLQDNLLDRLILKKMPAGSPNIHIDVESLLADIINTLYHKVRQSVVGKEAVLYEYLAELEHNVDGTRATIRHYTTTLAATCQQAVNYEMSTLKENIIFETVIIDEAARANPLDLFIPMSLAEKRIILVGDHRQLPHILEPEIEKQVAQSSEQATQNVLKKSLFERLFTEMRAREAQDGIKRTITLDAQYRMHPVLGQFVSDTFYKPYNESFESPLPADHFGHHLESYKNAVAAWINIPFAQGKESKGLSKSRRVEASKIAQEVQQLMQQQPELSFGVITFYTAQKQTILEAMAQLNSPLVEKNDFGEYEIAAQWRETTTFTERLRVGTVDAFQGKEFDVVILSMTRSNDLPADNDKALRQKYGHLMLENRLCVAMSRQKCLLIVVGDLTMLQDKAAVQAIPGLLAFRQLCEGKHGICF